MIFGSKQNKALATQICKEVAPVLALAKTKHGLPTGFWSDAYALGYLMGQINAYMDLSGGDTLSVADRGRVMVECFGILSEEKGKPISENAMVFATQEEPDFLRANQSGMFMAMFAEGKVPNAETIPAVIAAGQAAGDGASHDAVVDQLTRTLWVDEMRARTSVGGALA